MTVTLRGLDALGRISVRRNRNRILDRPALQALACDCYGIVRQQTSDLMTTDSSTVLE